MNDDSRREADVLGAMIDKTASVHIFRWKNLHACILFFYQSVNVNEKDKTDKCCKVHIVSLY